MERETVGATLPDGQHVDISVLTGDFMGASRTEGRMFSEASFLVSTGLGIRLRGANTMLRGAHATFANVRRINLLVVAALWALDLEDRRDDAVDWVVANLALRKNALAVQVLAESQRVAALEPGTLAVNVVDARYAGRGIAVQVGLREYGAIRAEMQVYAASADDPARIREETTTAAAALWGL
jgi:hypothetical protein